MADSGYRFDGNYIHFFVEVQGAHVHCAVTYAYLVNCCRDRGIAFANARAAFASLRSEIEALAASKFVAGSERPLVVASDCA